MEMDAESGKDTELESVVMGGNVPSNYIPAVEKGFYEALEKGTLSGNPISGVRMVLQDGAFHAVDSLEPAFRLAAVGTSRETSAVNTARPLSENECWRPIISVWGSAMSTARWKFGAR
jgi:translation elongation factor EF-G